MRSGTLLSAILAVLVGGCPRPPDSGQNPDGGTPGTLAVVTTASYTSSPPSGALGAVGLADRHVTPAIDTTLDADNDVRCEGGRCYVLDRTHGTVRIYNPAAGWQGTLELRTGDAEFPAASSNPHDVVPIPGTSKLYAALYNHDALHALGVLDTSQPGRGVVRWIAVPQSPGDGDGRPEANNLYLCGGLIYVTLEYLDTTSPFYTPAAPGRIVVVDPTLDQVITGAEIQLIGQNPVAIVAESGDCRRVLVANAAQQFGAVDGQGGIERVDLTTRQSLGVLADDRALGGHPGGLTVTPAGLVYVMLNLPDFTARLDVWNLATGQRVGEAAGPTGYIPFARVTPDGREIYMGVASGDLSMGQLGPGLYIGPSDGSRITSAPLELGQSPNAISFY